MHQRINTPSAGGTTSQLLHYKLDANIIIYTRLYNYVALYEHYATGNIQAAAHDYIII